MEFVTLPPWNVTARFLDRHEHGPVLSVPFLVLVPVFCALFKNVPTRPAVLQTEKKRAKYKVTTTTTM